MRHKRVASSCQTTTTTMKLYVTSEEQEAWWMLSEKNYPTSRCFIVQPALAVLQLFRATSWIVSNDQRNRHVSALSRLYAALTPRAGILRRDMAGVLHVCISWVSSTPLKSLHRLCSNQSLLLSATKSIRRRSARTVSATSIDIHVIPRKPVITFTICAGRFFNRSSAQWTEHALECDRLKLRLDSLRNIS